MFANYHRTVGNAIRNIVDIFEDIDISCIATVESIVKIFLCRYMLSISTSLPSVLEHCVFR